MITTDIGTTIDMSEVVEGRNLTDMVGSSDRTTETNVKHN
jgi:hypothetical protein